MSLTKEIAFELKNQLEMHNDRFIKYWIAKHFGNPDTFFVFYYHLTYLISLIKTIADNVCWILNLYLKLKIDHFDLDLLNDRFKNVTKNNKQFHNILYSNNYYPDYEKLNEFRDIIQHRHVIRSMRVVSSISGENKILIPKNPEKVVANKIKTNKNDTKEDTYKIAEDIESLILYGLHEYFLIDDYTSVKDYVDPLKFCKIHVDGICNLVNSIFERIVDETTRKPLGKVIKFYPKLSVALIEVSHEISNNDFVMVEGNTTLFKQQIESMEVDHKRVEKFENGLVGIKVIEKVRVNDKMYLTKKIDNSTFLNLNYL